MFFNFVILFVQLICREKLFCIYYSEFVVFLRNTSEQTPNAYLLLNYWL